MTTVEVTRARVRRANKQFKKMTAADKRVAIAKDVIAEIKAQRIIPKRGAWVSADGCYTSPAYRGKLAPTDQLDSVFSSMPSCHACALGSLLVCAVKRFDDFTVGELARGSLVNDSLYIRDISQFDSYLMRFFGLEQIRAMEQAFEQGAGTYQDARETPLIKRAREKFATREVRFWGTEWVPDGSSHEDRLLKMMRNVIRNKGTFKP